MEIKTSLDVVEWCYKNNSMPIPCRPKTKKAILDICEHKINENNGMNMVYLIHHSMLLLMREKNG